MTGLPPGPRAPAIVNTARLLQRPYESLLGWQRRYGNVFTVSYLVFGTGVYVAEPEALKELLTGDQSDLHAGEANEPLSPVLGPHSVLVLDGAEHMRQRKLLLPPFQGSAVTAFREVIRDVAEAEVASWRAGSELVLRERMRALTFEVICKAVFGVTEPERVERLRGALTPLMDFGVSMFLPGPLRRELGPLSPLSPWARFQRRLGAADVLLYEEIERRRGETDLDERTDVLSLLMRARDEDGEPMSDAELRDELMTMLAAGHETTATGLAFAFDLLIHHTDVLDRLRQELETGDDAYLDAVVTESLRVRPVIDAAERTLTKPRQIAGWELPAGIRVYPAILCTHYREDLYPDPAEFQPDRFFKTNAESYSWLPFGGGIRRCIGAALAQAEMAEVIRTVLSRVDLAPLRDELEPVIMRGVTLIPKHGTAVRIQSSRPGSRSSTMTGISRSVSARS